ncbi:LysR family transcriptional regulator [Virgisporangium ochraceum]|uniref:LysR family transcriptional regulator n=1 Tax=Virgisporangium ochraceum TaxID=65505 RepID=A0A8J3ZNS8_9ACTN|nr:LysR family transcriptional regulator [Virgisporangium ochraceum]GIJ67081.1 LysR family transcriptional regulator [Virgisporangium ochraceum]
MTDIELRHLAAFAAVADEGSFGRAALRLGYTQSTISQQVAALEKAVGGAVFDRPGGPKRVRITPLGAVVLAHGRDLLAKAAGLATAVDRFRAGDGRIDLGTFQSVSNVLLPQVVQRLREGNPGCEIRLFEEETDPPRLDDLDLVFFDGRVDGDVTHHKLLDDPYRLVARPGTFPPGPVRLADLDGAPLVTYPPLCDQARVERELARAGVRPRVVFRTVGNEAIMSMVRAGIGWALLPRLAVHHETTLSVHPLEPALAPREIFLLWQAGRTHSPLAARAIDIAVEVARELEDAAR